MRNKFLQLPYLMAAMVLPLVAQDDPFADGGGGDPFADGNQRSKLQKVPKGHASPIQLVYEVFSLPLSQATALQRGSVNDKKLFAQMIAGVKDKSVKQESFVITRGSSGHKAVSLSVEERIYPTEFKSPELPNYVGGSLSMDQVGKLQKKQSKKEKLNAADLILPAANAGLMPITPATPTTFDTRYVGVTVEAESHLSQTGKTIDLRMFAEHVTLLGHDEWGQGVALCKMPAFETSRVQAGISVGVGQPTLIGTVTPKSEADRPEEPCVWFAFITASVVKQ